MKLLNILFRNTLGRILVYTKLKRILRNERILRKICKLSRNPIDKQMFQMATKELKKLLIEQKSEQLTYLLRNLIYGQLQDI